MSNVRPYLFQAQIDSGEKKKTVDWPSGFFFHSVYHETLSSSIYSGSDLFEATKIRIIFYNILSPKKFDIPTVHKICIVNPD